MALKITFLDSLDYPDSNLYRAQPFKKGGLLHAKIANFNILSQGEDIKTVYSLKLDPKAKLDYLPGDTIGILARNDEDEVKKILIRLNCQDISAKVCKLEREDGKPLPAFLPPFSTLSDIFLNHVNIRAPPKKAFLSALIPFASDAKEKEVLSLIASPKGKEKYADLIANKASTLLGVLNEFLSVLPPVDKVLSHLTALTPRFYSICSSPISGEKNSENCIEIAFFVNFLSNGMKGICTGWLEKLIQSGKSKSPLGIPIYLREPTKFRFGTENNDIPTVLVATGTGICPFIGFLRYRRDLMKNAKFSDITLYYGCRYERDFLFKSEIMDFLETGALSRLYSTFSRETGEKEYVHHKLWQNRREMYDFLLKIQGKVYICGSKEMVKDVRATFINIVQEIDGCEEKIAEGVIKELEIKGNILIDLWT